ncbi:hypothetical protein VTK26DRAFT_175 [Humicola hyalothermophila]
MARTGFFHHVGSFLLFSASVLLIITCISAPVVNDIALLKVELEDGPGRDHSAVTFGTFGYCQTNVNGQDLCSDSRVGYSPAAVMRAVDGTRFSEYAEDTARVLTRVMILHPVACGLNFLAFLLALGAGALGSLLAGLVALLAFAATAVACVVDFVLFGIVRNHVRDNNDELGGSDAEYGAAAWTALVSAVCSLVGAVVVFATCCSARLRRRREVVVKEEGGAVPRRRWGRW